MKNFYLLVFTFITLGLLVSSCSLQKRHYMKGYHLETSGDVEQNTAEQSALEERQKAALAAAAEGDNLIASLRGGDEFVTLKPPSIVGGDELARLQALPLQECDTIVQKNGVKIMAKVTETASDLIKYKDCDLPDGPVFTIKQSQVTSIKYVDGTSEIFLTDPKEDISIEYAEPRRQEEVRELANWSILLGFLSFIPFYGFFTGIRAIETGNDALELYKKSGMNDPKVKRRATTGKVLGIIGIVFWICLPIVAVVLLFLGI